MFQRWLGNQLRQPKGLFSKWIGNYMQKGNTTINHWTTEVLSIGESEVILEVGIGNGSTINQIVRNNKIGRVIGIDISNEMLRRAEKINKQYIEQGVVELHYADVMDLPFKDSSFDKVFTVHTIYFWTDMNRAFYEIYRVLKPGGKVYISLANKSHMEKMQRTKSFHLLDIDEVEVFLNKNKFMAIKRHENGVFWCLEALKG